MYAIMSKKSNGGVQMLTDIEIATANKQEPIVKIAKKLGIKKSDLELYGNNIAKINAKNKKNRK